MQSAACPNLVRSDPSSVRTRGRRVCLLLIGVTVLGLGDLLATTTHMNGVGLIEANPFARHLVEAGSTEGLVLFKLGSIGIAIGLILRVRNHRAGEIGGWVLVAIMAVLTLHWHHYSMMLDEQLRHVEDLDAFVRNMRLAAASRS